MVVKMGREVKRVSMDFDWYEKTKDDKGRAKTWKGYILQIMTICPLCDGDRNRQDCPMFCDDDGYIDLWLEPPKGEGWQMWENVSEGSPISPVVKTKEELARWLSENTRADDVNYGATYEQWLKMIEMGYCPSFGFIGDKFIGGVKLHSTNGVRGNEM